MTFPVSFHATLIGLESDYLAPVSWIKKDNSVIFYVVNPNGEKIKIAEEIIISNTTELKEEPKSKELWKKIFEVIKKDLVLELKKQYHFDFEIRPTENFGEIIIKNGVTGSFKVEHTHSIGHKIYKTDE